MMQPKEKLLETMGWVEDYEPRTIKLIGLLEVLGAIGLVVPALTDIAPTLVPVAAIGIVLVMIGAMAKHIQRGGETQMVMMNVVFAGLALFVAVFRLGDYAF